MTLKNKVVKGIGWTIMLRFLGQALRMAGKIVLARMLIPEDFGLVAVEAQSFGVPVIAYKSGGALDTVVEGKTGVYFSKQNRKSLKKAINKFETMKFNDGVIKNNAKRFSKERFKEEFSKVVKEI